MLPLRLPPLDWMIVGGEPFPRHVISEKEFCLAGDNYFRGSHRPLAW